jgi:hypothetical protein
MGIFDKAREALHEHADKVDPVVDRVADEADRRTGGTHGQHVDRVANLAKDELGEQARRDTAPEPGPPA